MNRWVKQMLSLMVIAGLCFSFTGPACAVSPQEKQQIEAAVPDKATVQPKQPRKLLVFTLCKGWVHSAIPYGVEALQAMAHQTGAFSVVVSDDVSMFQPDHLKQFDAVCFNNTTGEPFDDPELKKSLLEFVKGGKGLVGIHAATDSFYKWPEFGEMMGGYFDGHPWGSGGTWAVKIDDPAHPLMAAFGGKGFKINDEIYRIKAPYSREKLRVLMSLDMTDEANLKAGGVKPDDTDIGISWVRDYGKGRVFYCSLGHNHHLFWNPTVLRHYLDGIQFALGDLEVDTTVSAALSDTYQKQARATAQRTPWDEALENIKNYQFGQSRESLSVVADMVRDSAENPDLRKELAQRLAHLLESNATYDCKQFLCRQLSLIGTEKQVPVLAKLLPDEQTSDMARYALERIPGAQVDQALREALGQTKGRIKVGIINSLGNRADTQAVDSLIDLINDPDQEIAGAAVGALGKIGGKEAAGALDQALEKTEGPLRLAVKDAYLLCADKLLADGQNQAAAKIYEQMYAEDEPQRIRTAALAGLVATGSEQGISFVLAALASEDPALCQMAVRFVREIPGKAGTKAFAEELPRMAPAGQVQLLSALADRGDPEALAAVEKTAQSNDDSVRVAALKALGKLGNDSTVKMLIERALSGKGDEQAAAQDSLDMLRGDKVNDRMLSLLASQPETRAEMIRTLAARNAAEATPALMGMTSDKDPKIRSACWKGLRMLCSADNLTQLVGLLTKADETDRKEAEQTVAKVSRRVPDENQRAAAVLAELEKAQQPEIKSSLLRVLGAIGAPNSLDSLRAAFKDDNEMVRDAAIRGLSSWPTAQPMGDLLAIAKNGDNQVHRVLALRGFIDMIAKAELPADEKLNMYDIGMNLAQQDTAQKQRVLAGISQLQSLKALEMARKYLGQEGLQQEAALAAAQIAQNIYVQYPDQVREIMTEALASASNDSIRQQCRKVLQLVEALGAYITQWQVSGPYTEKDKDATLLFDVAFAPEVEQAEVQWRPMPMGLDRERPWVLDLQRVIGGDQRAAYIRTAVWSGQEQQVNLLTGSDDGIKVWLNDKVVFQTNVIRGMTADQDKINVKLVSGWNLLLLKITQEGGSWSACARFQGLDGKNVEGLKYDAQGDLKKRLIEPASDSSSAQEPGDDFMGDWQGYAQTTSGERRNFAAQVIGLGDGAYQIPLLEEFDRRLEPMTVLEAQRKGNKVTFTGAGREWSGTGSGVIEGKTFKGEFLGSEWGEFEMRPVLRLSPLLGATPPAGALVLFDGSGFDQWQRVGNIPWIVDLAAEIGGQNRAAFLRNRVWSDNEQRALLEIGSDDGVKVWLNGEIVHARNVARAVKPGEDKVNITLKPGWNPLMLKVTQGDGGWAACARVVGADGKDLDTIRFEHQLDVSHHQSLAEQLKNFKGYIVAWEMAGPYWTEGKSGLELIDVPFAPEQTENQVNWRFIPNMENLTKINFKLLKDGAMEVGPGSIITKKKFRDLKAHVEFRTPYMPKAKEQARGNSGVYILGLYEVQVLDSYGLEGKDNECGGIYKVAAPRVNMCAPPGQWQSYDIEFHAARFDDSGKKTKNARITVIHNGVTIQENLELPEPTGGAAGLAENRPGGIYLQDHGNPVQYRNIWAVDLEPDNL